MVQQKSILKNSIFNSLKVLSNLIFPVVSFAYAARILGDSGVGRVTFARSIVSLYENINKELISREKNVIFGGRLGKYKHYDMGQVIVAAL